MADGQSRYQPAAAGQQFYSQFSSSRQIHHRPSSPAVTRRNFAADASSPTRSPAPRSPARNAFGSMFGGNHAGLTSHNMLNGSGHQRFGGQLGMNKAFQPQHHPSQHNQHNQTGQDAGHGMQHGNFISHQHNQSGGVSGAYGQGQLQNGANSRYDNPNTPHTAHWDKQMQVANEIRNLTHAHPHARNASSASKIIAPGATPGISKAHDAQSMSHENRGSWEDDEAEKSPWTEIDMGGANLRSLSFELFDYYPFLTKLYLNNNRLQEIPADIGRLRNLTHLDLSLNSLTYIPPEMGMLVNLQTLMLVDNKIDRIPFEMGNLCKLVMLAVDGNPLNEQQRDVIAEHGPQALISQLREAAPGPDPPNQRDWIVLDDSEAAPGEKFTAISFNILSKMAATPQQFGYTPSHALNWEYRQRLILEEITTHDADIVCLQEMEGTHYHDVFREHLARSDYKGIYFPRGKASLMSNSEMAKAVDGCATFVKNDKFIVLDKQCVEMSRLATQRPDVRGESDTYNRVMPRDNIGVLVFLENRLTGSRLICVNTHLYWDQHYRDVKVVQAAILMEETQKAAEKWAKWPPTPDKDKVRFRYTNGSKEGEEDAEEAEPAPAPPSMSYERGLDIPMIVCGDFNSTPGSGVHELLTTGQLAPNHKDFGIHKYGEFTKSGARHGFGLKSSYGQFGELPFTNYVPNFVGVLDYIFFSTSSLTCTGMLGEVDPEYLRRVPGFPNIHFPSDHLLMFAEFKCKGPKRRGEAKEVDFGGGKENRRS